MRPQAVKRNVLPVDSKLWIREAARAGARGVLVAALAMFLTACSYSALAAAHSGPAAIGAPERVGLWDCEDARDGPTIVDFDESLWLPVGADPADLMDLADVADAPGDTATMTLVSTDFAEYRSDRGPVFTFERHGDTFEFAGCVPYAWLLDEGSGRWSEADGAATIVVSPTLASA